MKRRIALALLILGFVTGCRGSQNSLLAQVPPAKEQSQVKVSQDIKEAIYQMTKEISPKVLAESSENRSFSPLSLWNTLGVLREGAKNDTLKDLNKLMALPPTFDSAKSIPEVSKALNFMKEDKDKKTGLSVVNGLFFDQGFKDSLNSDFLKSKSAIWGTEVASLDFKQEDAAKEFIKNWVSEKSNHFMKDYKATINEDTVLNIYNVLYLKDHWLDKYNKLPDQPFEGPNGPIKLPFIQGRHKNKYFEEKGFRGVGLPGSTGLTMWFVLPPEGQDPTSALPLIKDIMTKNNTLEVDFKGPMLEMNTEKLDLKKILQAKGYHHIFGDSDYSGISKKSITVTDLSQRCKLKMDEKGFEAVAVTEVVAGTTSAPFPTKTIQFTVDRPFLVIIEYQGLPLFLSKVMDPSKT